MADKTVQCTCKVTCTCAAGTKCGPACACMPGHFLPSSTTNTFIFTKIPVQDFDRASAFYTAVCDWDFHHLKAEAQAEYDPSHHRHMSAFTHGESKQLIGALCRFENEFEGEAAEQRIKRAVVHIISYLGTEDIDASLTKVKKAGGVVVKEKWTDSNGVELAHFADTEGNVLGFMTVRSA